MKKTAIDLALLLVVLLLTATVVLPLASCNENSGKIAKVTNMWASHVPPFGCVLSLIYGDSGACDKLSPNLSVELKPTSSAIAGYWYTVDLYERGKFRDSTMVSWNQAQINVHDPQLVFFALSQSEYNAYFFKPLGDIEAVFSVKVYKGESTPVATPRPSVTVAKSRTPVITSVSTIRPTQTQTITIHGQGFGQQNPYIGNSPYLVIFDLTRNWSAGCYPSCGVTLNVTSWGDTQIVISGFTGGYGTQGWVLYAGDAIKIQVWNAPSKGEPANYTTTVSG